VNCTHERPRPNWQLDQMALGFYAEVNDEILANLVLNNSGTAADLPQLLG